MKSLIHRWKADAIALPPESRDLIVATFEHAGFVATSDVVDFYCLFGGMKEMDDGYLRVWPLSEVKEHRTDQPEFGLAFADYLIDAWWFRLKPVNPEISAVYVDAFNGEPRLVASSLTEFFLKYEQEHTSVL